MREREPDAVDPIVASIRTAAPQLHTVALARDRDGGPAGDGGRRYYIGKRPEDRRFATLRKGAATMTRPSEF